MRSIDGLKKKMKLNKSGMTLIEVIAAMAILALVITPTLRIFASSSGTNFRAKSRQRATSVAEGVMESFKAYDMESLCIQFLGGSFKGVVAGGAPMSTEVKAYDVAGNLLASPLRQDGVLNIDTNARYEFKVENASSQGRFYDVTVEAVPVVAPNAMNFDDPNQYSDAIIALDEDQSYNAAAALETKAKTLFEADFTSLHSGATSHGVDSVELTDFTRTITLDVTDDGTAQTVLVKEKYTATATVSYHYSTGVGASSSSHTGNVTYDSTKIFYDMCLPDDSTTDTEWTVYDNTSTIAGVVTHGGVKHSKLNHIYLYYFPSYTGGFGTGAKDVIEISGTLSSLYDPAMSSQPKATGHMPLQITVAKQRSTYLTDTDVNLGEVTYNVSLQGSFSGSGSVELVTNLYENLSPLGSVSAVPSISGFPSPETVAEGVDDKVVLLYDIQIHVYEHEDGDAVGDEVATFSGTMNN